MDDAICLLYLDFANIYLHAICMMLNIKLNLKKVIGITTYLEGYPLQV